MLVAAALAGGAIAAAVMSAVVYWSAPEVPEVAAPARAVAPATVSGENVAAPASREAQVESARAARAAAPCVNCGVVRSVEPVTKKGEASGGGAVAGGVVGAVVGHQIGEGRGKDAATIIGALGGAVAGNEIEKNVKKSVHYRVSVRMNDGRTEVFTLDTVPGFAAGDQVKIVDGRPVKQR
jgi:outer membrane lipoprotein SlyB